jgi:hypothetical protein
MNVGKLREQLRGNTSCGLPNETLSFDLDLASQFVYAGVADYNTARPLSSLACLQDACGLRRSKRRNNGQDSDRCWMNVPSALSKKVLFTS